MKRNKRIFSLILLFAIIFSSLPTTVFANALTGTVTSITAPDNMEQGSSQTISFNFKISEQNTIGNGDTVTITTNWDEIFDTAWDSTYKLFSNNEEVGTVSITGGKSFVITFTKDIQDATNFVGTITSGNLKVKDVGATVDTPKTKTLTIGNISKDIKITKKEGGGTDPGNPDPTEPKDPVTIDYRFFVKGAWDEHYNTRGHIKIIINNEGALGLFKTNQVELFPNWMPVFVPRENVIVEDPIPENGVINESSIVIYAIRNIYFTATNNNTQGFKKGAIYPLESGSKWHNVKNLMTKITQEANETYESFKDRITKTTPSYGIYKDPQNGGDTFIANFGSLSENGFFTYKQFEPNLITNNPKLENIFGETGPSKGKVVSFNIEFTTSHPTLAGQKTFNNTATLSSTSLTSPVSSTAPYTLNNGSGFGVGSSGSITIKVVDEDDNTIVIDGAEFKVVDTTGNIVSVNGKPVTGKTNSDGILLLGPLPVGDYKLVQVTTKDGYSFTNDKFNPNMNGSTQIGLAPNKDTGEFTITLSDKEGYSTLVPNKKNTVYPQVVSYKVEHYQENLDKTYTLKDTENKTGKSGEAAAITEKTYAGFSYDSTKTTYEDNANTASTTVLPISADGRLIVKLYYNRNTYTLSYDANGGTGEVPASSTPKFGEEVTVSFDKIPTLNGSKFLGWSDNKNDTQPKYTANGTKTFSMPANDVTLYAIYEKNVYTVSYNANGGFGNIPSTSTHNFGDVVSVSFSPVPSKSEHRFLGWSESANATIPTYSSNGLKTFTMPARNVVLYAVYSRVTDVVIPPFIIDPTFPTTPTVPTTPVKPVTVGDWLNMKDHFAYVIGYPDGTFRQGNSITRAEVTTIFTRLMLEKIAVDGNYPNPFTDVLPNGWYVKPITFANSKGIVKGYPDNTFKPDNAITRAEFAAICARFDNSSIGSYNANFTDVSTVHWAYDSIIKAQKLGWITGYPDGTFKPDQAISREEVVTVVNRMLNRQADENFINTHRNEIVKYTDLQPGHWSYLDVMEASNSHDYERVQVRMERWIRLTVNR